jgi:transposase InsO family protein
MSWLSKKELMALTSWNAKAVERKVNKGQLQTRPTKGRKNGRAILKYSSESLPFEFRVKAKQERSALPKETALALPPPPAVQETPATQPPVKVAFASPEQETQARERYAIIDPLVRFQPDQRLASPGQLQLALAMVLPDGSPVTTRTQMRLYLANKHDLSEVTIYRWVRAFTKRGLVGLADQARSDRGSSRFFEKHPDAATLAAYLYLGQRQSVRAAYEAIQRDCLLLKLKPCELPSYETVRAFLKRTPEPLMLLAREGRRAYTEICAPYISRRYDDVTSNEIWVSDHALHDVECQNDCFLDADFGTPIRLRLTAILDFRSRFVVGCSWAWEGSSRSITTALRRAVALYGPAEVFYCDNGKDYLKVGRGAMPAYLRESNESPTEWYTHEMAAIEKMGVLARLGMSVQHCIVRHPQSKHVERFFRTMHERFDKKFPTYTGGSPDRRPDFTTEAMAEHRKLLRIGEPGMSLHPPASAFIRLALAWLDQYHSTPHRGKGMDGRTPRQVFEQERNPRQKPVPAPEVLALMLRERQRRNVQECSIVLEKKRYIGDDQISAAMLHELNSREVVVAFDPLDLEKVAILDNEGRLIAWARQQNYVTQSANANEEIAASMQQRRHLEKQTRQLIGGIAAAARANGARTDVEHLAMRAGVAGVSDVVTQRRPRLRPDNRAVAPLSACEIARQVLAIGEKK